MTGSALTWVIVAFVCYLILMIVIGALCAKGNNNSEDYFLGGRSLGGFVAAMSAQASDMSGWLLMGLPGAIYLTGIGGDGWTAIGLFIGTAINWIFIASRLRRYTIRANNSLTLPMYFQNRFHDNKRILMTVSSITIVIFFLVYTASAFASSGQLFQSVFGMDYHVALTVGAAVVLIYTFMGGFMAVCMTDFVQGFLMLVGILVVPIVAWALLSGDGMTLSAGLAASGVESSNFLNLMKNGDGSNNIAKIISGLGWGLGYFGMPHILVRFMAVRDEGEMKKSKVTAITWVILSLFFASLIGIVGRAYLPNLGAENSEKVFIEMIKKVFVEEIPAPFLAGIFLCGILAAIMSTADSQLLVSASSMAEDIFKGLVKKDADDKTVMRVSRITVLAVAIIAYIIAWNPNNTIMGLVSNAWAGLGAAFGPLVVMSLYWKRTTFQGGVAGIITGALTVILWDYIPFVNGETLGDATGIYSLVVGFALSILVIVIVSLCTPMPSEEILKEFEDVDNKEVTL